VRKKIMEYRDIMHEAARVFNDRNPKYGDMRVGMERVAHIATMITGIQLSAHDIALVLHAVKLSRLDADRKNPDHYVDGINYLAFAGELIESSTSAENIIDSEFAKMAAQFSATRSETAPQEG
jgi:hypothetical protein